MATAATTALDGGLPATVELLRLAHMGLRLFPLAPRGKNPLLQDWPNQASDSDEQLQFWAKRWPNCNWGLATGIRSGVFVVDFDGEEGLGVLHSWIAEHGPEWPETRGVKTKRGGHLYFKWPKGETLIRNSAGKIAPGVDVRGEGGYVIVPPSVHPDGPVYAWAGDEGAPIAEAPAWLVDAVVRASGPQIRSDIPPGNGNAEDIPEGQRNATLTSLAGTLRRRGMTLQAIEAALLAENAARCKPTPLLESEVCAIAASVSRYTPGVTIEMPAAQSPTWPEPLAPGAFHGLAGEYVRTVEPASEADPAALLLQFLVAAGNAIGHRPYFVAEDTPHYLNLYAVLVGLTSKSRKGTSWNRVKKLFADFDGHWTSQCIASGLSSGEGLIEAVRDSGGEDDVGITDKRLLISQGEFCGVLRAMERDGNTVSIVLRDAWDGVILRTMTRKNNALRSSDSHVSLIGHITRDELRSRLTETDKANGFANRILWVCIARSKELADEVEIDGGAWTALISSLKSAVGFARNANRLRRSDDAQAIWRNVYHDLSEGKMGMFGAVTSRGEAQVVRLSSLYALLDWSETIRPEHLKAALAVWRYCEESARYIFGDALGDSVADTILAALANLKRIHIIYSCEEEPLNLETSTCERILWPDCYLVEMVHLDGRASDLTDQQLEEFINRFPIRDDR